MIYITIIVIVSATDHVIAGWLYRCIPGCLHGGSIHARIRCATDSTSNTSQNLYLVVYYFKSVVT